jgi:hypothetical protein
MYQDLDVSRHAAAAAEAKVGSSVTRLAAAAAQVKLEVLSTAKVACDLVQALPCALGRPLDKRVDAAAGLASALLAMAKLSAQHSA